MANARRGPVLLAASVVAAVLWVLVLLPAATASPSARSGQRATGGAPRLQVGISYGDTLVWMSDSGLAAALDDAVTVGARWVRVDLSWQDVQYDAPNRYRWNLFDRVVTAANQRGLMVLPVLAYTPPWARAARCDSGACPPTNPATFAAFAKTAARRYAPRGVHTWEIWNEPNIVGFWEPRPSADAYTILLRDTVQALREADPMAKSVLGGLAAVRTDASGNESTSEFLARVASQGGTQLVSAVGYHPYTYPYLPSAKTSFATAWERMNSGTDSLRSVLARYSTPNVSIWITEIGAPTGGPGPSSDGSPASIGPTTTHVTEARQSQIATDAVRTAAADPTVGALFWYSDRDLGTDRSSNENFYGLRRADGTAKPAFTALREAIAVVNAPTSPER